LIFIYITLTFLLIAEIMDLCGSGYQQWTTPQRILFRCIMMAPLLLSAITNIHWFYSIFIIILYILILTGDCLIDYFYQAAAILFFIVQAGLIVLFTIINPVLNIIPLGIIIIVSILYYDYLIDYLQWPITLLVPLYLLFLSVSVWRGFTTGSYIISIGMILWYLCDTQVFHQIYVDKLKITLWGQFINNILWYGALIGLALFNYYKI
jgi:hypothetical protein